VRRVITRFDKENIRANQPLLDLITDFANSKDVTPRADFVGVDAAQERLHRAHPGSRTLECIQESLGPADVELTNDEFAQIEGELAKIEIHGTSPEGCKHGRGSRAGIARLMACHTRNTNGI
jgi:aryl-alcohol dehydrogenase-like predicted oxidoreductase